MLNEKSQVLLFYICEKYPKFYLKMERLSISDKGQMRLSGIKRRLFTLWTTCHTSTTFRRNWSTSGQQQTAPGRSPVYARKEPTSTDSEWQPAASTWWLECGSSHMTEQGKSASITKQLFHGTRKALAQCASLQLPETGELF